MDAWYYSLPTKTRSMIDVCCHVVIAFWIIAIIGSLTYYLGNICKELFVLSALLSLPMIPIRILTLKYLEACKRDQYLKEVLDEVLYQDNNGLRHDDSKSSIDDDDEDWFMRIANGR